MRPVVERKIGGKESKGVNSMNQPTVEAVSVVLPAFNEEEGVIQQIESLREVLDGQEYPYEIILVDDASTDGTVTRALQAGIRVIKHNGNRGYGAALKTGIRAASYDYIVIIDADNTYPAKEIPVMLEKLQHADMVVGARTGGEVHVPFMRRPAKWFLRWLAMHIVEREIPDLNSGLRAFRRDCVEQYFPIVSNRFSFTTTTTMALLADDYRVIYHPIDYFPRTGRSKIAPRHFMDFIVLIIRMSMMFQPLKVFIPLSLVTGLTGTAKAVYDIFALFYRSSNRGFALLTEPVLSTSAVLLMLVGLQMLLIGMVADGVVRRIAQHNRPSVPSNGIVDVHPEVSLALEGEMEGPIATEIELERSRR